MRALFLVGLLVGCRSEINPLYCAGHADPRCPDGGHTFDDGGTDTFSVPEAGDRTCFGGGAYMVCLQALPNGTANITTAINTAAASGQCAPMQPNGWSNQGQPDACFIVAKSIAIGGKVAATGPRPLVLVATESITVNNTLDVAAKRDMPTVLPAGFDNTRCTQTGAMTPGNDTNGAGGGAGGTNITKGGNGGAGAGGGGTAGTAANPLLAPTTLRGGCAGQTGGTGNAAGGDGGNGGGVVYLVAPMITFGPMGVINASGAGGSAGGNSEGGGGGGGAGGMIVMWADTFAIDSAGKLVANGGGGASGGNGNKAGEHGSDPAAMMVTTPAGGGAANGGDGGDGFAGTTNATPGLTQSGAAGGGGGGGGGYIQVNQAITITSSPGVVVAQ